MPWLSKLVEAARDKKRVYSREILGADTGDDLDGDLDIDGVSEEM